MRLEIEQLRQEVSALRGEIRRSQLPPGGSLKSSGEAAEDYSPTAQPPGPADRPTGEEDRSAEEIVPLLQAQVAEQAQTKVESNSRLPVKIFGTIVSNTFFNTGEVNWLDNPNIVVPTPGSLPAGSFSSTLRQSRMGAIVDGPAVGSLKSTGLFAVDFFGGIPNFQTGQVMPLPRLLYAYVRLEGVRTALEIGQDHAIFAPRNPTSLASLAFPGLCGSGNLYLRAPQVRVERAYSLGKSSDLQATAGILAPVGGDFARGTFEFAPPNLAGERSRRPALEARVAWRSKPAASGDNRGWLVGLSGHYGRERFVTGTIGSRAVALDFDVNTGRLGAAGEWFVGRNIDAFSGSLGQLAKSTGGFLEGRLKATRRLELNAGYGTDHLFDLRVFPVALSANSSLFANTIFQITPELATSFEYRWLRTTPLSGTVRHNNHFDFVLAYSF